MAENPNTPAVEIAFRTDPGRDPEKQVNEDAVFHVETPHGLLAVVCDGMGGHAGGKEASELATKTIREIVLAAPAVTSPRDALKVAIEEANRRVWGMPTDEGGFRPGSTVVAVLAHAAGAEVAHVGDSRVYLLHAGAITQVTKDHSMVQQMVDAHLLAPEEAAGHPDANRISRALGMHATVDVEVRPMPVIHVAGDAFLLCSDGLSDLVAPDDILHVVGTAPPEQAAGQLIDLANARGGHDNITVAILRARESALVHATALMPTLPQTMADAQASPPAVAARGPARTRVDSADDHEDRSAPSRISLSVVMGVALGLIGVAIAGLALYLLVADRHNSTNPPAFVDAGFAFKAKAPSVTVVVPDSVPDVLVHDSGAGELTPLLPHKPFVPTAGEGAPRKR